MIKKTLALILVLMMISVIVGCAKAPAEVKRIGEPTAAEEVSEDVDEVDTLTEDLDTSDLDDIDQDLDDITW